MELQKRLDKVFACKNLFYCSENERKEIKEYLIPAAFEYHFENCSLYKNYCEKIGIDPSKIKKIEDISKIPLLPSSIFKNQTVISGNKTDIVKKCTSSGTKGTVSCVYRDMNTIKNFFQSSKKNIVDLLNVENGECINLTPVSDAPEVKHLWLPYAMEYVKFAQSFWNKLVEVGDIYLGEYEGLYCVDCEQYYSKNELIDEKICPIHHKEVEHMKEESYFFRLSKYHDWLYEYIEKNDEFIVPQSRKKEILGFLRTERLKDFSISRTSFKWGIDVPDSKTHIMYVWIDALTNYISSLGGWESEEYEHYWNQTIHFLGKDILRFHAVYWPCMLKAAGVPLPQHIVAHGWWTISDKKISKSDPATKVNPVKIANDITIDGLRFYLLKETSLDRDGNLDYNHLIEVLNTYLANKIGNLVNRTVSMVNKYLHSEFICQENV